MPRHVVFDSEGATSQYQQDPSESFPSPSTSSSRPSKALPPLPSTSSGKRPRVASFHSDDEEQDDESSFSRGPKFAKDGTVLSKGALGAAKEAKRVERLLGLQRRKAESKRLEAGRMLLPIWEGKDKILEAMAANDTVVVLGETGSGKTTQVPQFLLDSSIPCANPRIAVTQPRRVAAITLAARVSAEVGCELGQVVGYTVRFDDCSSRQTRLKYLTDGTLLAEMLGDRDLEAYEVVIVDEAHERTLRTDMVLGFLKDVQSRRKAAVKEWKRKGKLGVERDGKEPKPLKIVVMSATIDAKRFSEFFNDAPVLFVKGRQHSVKVLYASEAQADYCDAALKTILDCHIRRPPGDILVFLPGQEDIESLQSSLKAYLPALRKESPKSLELLIAPLYAKLSPQEQAKAFVITPPNTRKVILATNVAETSVTIPGVKYVVDTGMAKEKEYHASVGIDSLVTEHISQSSALQRTGRAGRESAGVCFRLYTEKDFMSLQKSTKPEIQRVSLTFAMLHLLANGQEDVWEFEYMDKPSIPSITSALATLHGLEAIDKSSRITPFGKRMASLPLEPVLARVLLQSFAHGCPKEIIDLVSLLGSRDSLLVNSLNSRDEANAARKKFHHRSGDHFMLLNILRAYEDTDAKERKSWCKENFINVRAMSHVLEARKQLIERCGRLGLDSESSTGEEVEPVLNSLVAGLFANTAILQPDGSYRHSLSRQVIGIHPSSILHNKKALAIVYEELVLTTKPYARVVSSISLSATRSNAPAMFAAATN